jgi:ribosomal protein S18 acetylase RimI-like enzyme
MRIRPYRAADRDAVIALWAACGLVRPQNDPTADIERKLRAGGKWLLVAEATSGLGAARRVVGTVMAGYEGHRGWINYLAVEPDWQGGGIGRALMAEAERRLRETGCPKINLQVRTSKAAVIGFYERLGFTTDDVVSMGKRLVSDDGPRQHGLPWWRKARWWWAPALVVLVGLVLRVAHVDKNYGHPDETITVEVVGHMRSSGDWDTNWAKAPGLESSYRYDQYNFSSYIYGTFFFYRAVKAVPGLEEWRSRDGGFWVYRMFSALLGTVVVAQTGWLGRRLAGPRAGLVAGALAAVVPLLVQDAHYIRPEAFVTVLTLAAVSWSLPGGRWTRLKMFAAAVAVGLGVAAKVSLLPLALVPLVPALVQGSAGRSRARLAAGALALVGAGLAVGFAAGAPGALLHPEVFAGGVRHLAAQYAGLHPPHSNLAGGWVAGKLGGYFAATLGWPLVLAGGLGAAWLVGKRRCAEAGMLAGPVVFFAGYFCTRTVFFERNLSHVVPLFCVLAAVGLTALGNRLVRYVGGNASYAVAAVLALALWRPAGLSSLLVWEVFSGRAEARLVELEGGLRARYSEPEWRVDFFLTEAPLGEIARHFERGGGPLAIRVQDYHDEGTRQHLGRLERDFEFEVLATHRSVFPDGPLSTLRTYGSWTDRFFLVKGRRKTP